MTPFEKAVWPEDVVRMFGMDMLGEVYLNDVYQVNIRNLGNIQPFGEMMHLSIKRRDKEVLRDWRDLQWIKNQLCGKECEAVEIFPAESRLCDTANQFHLWVARSYRFPFGFADRLVLDAGMELPGIKGAKQRAFAGHVLPPEFQLKEQ